MVFARPKKKNRPPTEKNKSLGWTSGFGDYTASQIAMQNLSCILNGTSALLNRSCGNNTGSDQSYEWTYYTLTSTVLMGFLIPVIVLGNAFVILAFATTRHLRTTTNYFVLSLAVADILVGSLSLPIYTVAINKGRPWQNEHPTVNQLWTAVDIITAVASIVNLMYISVDRYVCIQYPLRYHALLRKTRVVAVIAVSWVYGVLNYSLVKLTYKKGRPRPGVMLAITIMAFVVPLVVIIAMYTKVGRIAFSHQIRMKAMEERNDPEATKSRKYKGTISLLKELKATRTLAVVIGAFVLCWFGYFVILLRASICNEWLSLNCPQLGNDFRLVVTSIQWIRYFNSSLNPFIYAVMDADMKRALKRFMKGKLRPSESSTKLSSFELYERS